VGLRLIFLGLDHLREAGENSPFVTDNDGRPLGRNPLRDVRVRRALSMAIDRGSITERIMDGAATPAGQFLPPGTFSHVPDFPPALRPEGARRLLAEAGYPNGFRIQLNTPNDRYINDARIARRSARCGRASACAPRSRRRPGRPSSAAPAAPSIPRT
jgi:peptide/nickel transport system substrate-binding protein